MQDSWSYIKDSGNFTADIIRLYPSISHEAALEALRKRPNERDSPKVPTEDIVRMADFVLKNNFFEFNSKVKR